LINKTIYIWASDSSKNSGEGRLAHFFLERLSRNKITFKIIKKTNFKTKFLNKVYNYRYLLPLIGIVNCWYYFLKGHKIGYLNYLPMWNFFIFLLLPPKSIIGPITGGANFNTNNFFIRKYVFPIFYKISEIIINFRKYNLLFSTDLLKKYLSNRTQKKSEFNFVIKNFSYQRKTKKNIDFLFYFRDHKNKKSFFPFKLINDLIILGFKINIVGSKLNIPQVINHKRITNKKLASLQARTFFTVASSENLYSLFTLECITNNVKILISKRDKSKIKYFNTSFLKINFNNLKELNRVKKLYI
tara:strand:+ start:662 stop:1564 length:903 start_codon:yes stop_codon:yes gene_type:complete